jgi:hypothetical protein
VFLPGEFEKKVKQLGLNPKIEKELIDIINQASQEDLCQECESKNDCEKYCWHKKWLNTYH